MKIKSFNIITVILIVIFFAGCEADMLVEKPQHLITSETLYSSLAGFETGLNGAY